MMYNEIPHLTDDKLADLVKTAHWRKGEEALEELVERHDEETAAEMVGTDKFRIKEILQ